MTCATLPKLPAAAWNACEAAPVRELMKIALASAVSCLLCACGAVPSPTMPPESRALTLTASPRVLFLGNSLTATQATSGDDMPAILSRFAASRGRALAVSEAIDLGHTLQESWNASIPQPYLTLGGPYDVIVYQEYSTLALENPDLFFSTALKTYQPSEQKALKPGAQMMLFENWALQDPSPYATRAQALAALRSSYAQLSTALSTANQIAPFADAWEKVFATRPQSFLFLSDGKHPSDAGIYLNACLMYALLFSESPAGMPALFLSAQDAAFLQGVAAGFIPAAPPADAGVADAGVADAGVKPDAGVADAGAADAGVAAADAGVADAGAAGSADAGAPDAAVPPEAVDAGSPETVPADPEAGAAVVPVAAPPASRVAPAGGCSSGGGARFPALALLLCLLWSRRRRGLLSPP